MFDKLFRRSSSPEKRVGKSREEVKKRLQGGDVAGALAAAADGTSIAIEAYGRLSEEHAIGLVEEALTHCIVRRFDKASALYLEAADIYAARSPGELPSFVSILVDLANRLRDNPVHRPDARKAYDITLRVLERVGLEDDKLFGALQGLRGSV